MAASMTSGGRKRWTRPHYTGDEIAIGIGVTFALHALPVMLVVLKVIHPLSGGIDEAAVVAKPVIAANVLKLGKPLDPNKLPDRLVPQRNTAPKKEILASREDPLHKNPPDAGPPPPNAAESDQTNKVAKNDPFAEDAGKPRQEVGSAEGLDSGTETDPSKVRAGDMYAARLGAFFNERWSIPSVISQAESSKLCVVFQINISPRMIIWHVQQQPIKKSGNDLFDDSARTVLQKLLDDRTTLPEPPPEVADAFKGRTVQVALHDSHGDGSRCR